MAVLRAAYYPSVMYAVESLVAIKNLPHYRHWPPAFIMYFREAQPKSCPLQMTTYFHISALLPLH